MGIKAETSPVTLRGLSLKKIAKYSRVHPLLHYTQATRQQKACGMETTGFISYGPTIFDTTDRACHGWSSTTLCAMPGNRHWTFRRLATTAPQRKIMGAKHVRHECSRNHVEHDPPTSHSVGAKPGSGI
ncbi:hypothetical protein PoB_001333500 [Plakobranchus ocellatus]|uniref:Uncharacterized protein n=1 Tax=Plakobranchus ocellatus TaxID=259542 RepID=A0AAV3YWI5_9GAST|nr:hypothetical protein PoB_001333500 [Plakobranchus ocellatus]